MKVLKLLAIGMALSTSLMCMDQSDLPSADQIHTLVWNVYGSLERCTDAQNNNVVDEFEKFFKKRLEEASNGTYHDDISHAQIAQSMSMSETEKKLFERYLDLSSLLLCINHDEDVKPHADYINGIVEQTVKTFFEDWTIIPESKMHVQNRYKKFYDLISRL